MLKFHPKAPVPAIAVKSALRAIAIGVAVGGLGFAFRSGAEALYDQVAGWADGIRSGQGVGGWLAFGACAVGVTTTVAWMVRRYAPEAAGSGVQEIEAALTGDRPMRAWRVLLAKFTGGMLALGIGMPLGREGPTIQMGGAVGELLRSRHERESGEGRNLTIAAGAAAGLAAAFNAPLSGLMLILEEMRRQFRFSSRGLQFLALCTLTAEITVRLLSEGRPVLPLGEYAAPSAHTIPLFLLFGVPCGLLGAAFNQWVLWNVDRLGIRTRGLVVPAAWGLGIALLWLLYPDAVGDGYGVLPRALESDDIPSMLGVLLMVRIATTSGAFATGVPGGIFAPLVSAGVLLGCAVGPALRELGLPLSNLQLGVAGIGGMFAAMVQAPVTGTVLAIELTGDLQASLTLIATAIGANATARVLGVRGIYDALGERLPDLASASPSSPLMAPPPQTSEKRPLEPEDDHDHGSL